MSEGSFNVHTVVSAERHERYAAFVKQNRIKSVSALFLDAADEYVDSCVCPVCGARNPRGAHVCGVCLEPFDASFAEATALVRRAKKEAAAFEKNRWD